MKRIIYMAFPAMLLATGCSSDPEAVVPQGEPLRLLASLGDETRAAGNVWERNDNIGVRIIGNNGTQYQNTEYYATAAGPSVNFEYSDGSKIYFQPTETYEVFAYYPYGGQLDVVNPISVNTSSQTDQKSIDILGCRLTGVAGTSTSLNLNFKHYMARVNITFKPGKNVTFELLKTAVLSFANIKVNGALKPDRSGIEPTGNASRWIFSNFANPTDNATAQTRTYSLIVVPPLSTDSKSLTLECQIGGGVNSCTFSMDRAAGTSQNVEITVSRGEPLEVSSVTTTDWSEGKNETVK